MATNKRPYGNTNTKIVSKTASKSKASTTKPKTTTAASKSTANTVKTKMEKISPKVIIVKFLVLIILTGGLFVGSLWTNEIEKFVNYKILHNDGGTQHVYENGLSIHFIDVGQADAIAVVFPDNRVMMFDSGDNTNTSRNNMKNYLDTYVFAEIPKTIDWFVLTHSDADHVGGAAVLFDNYDIKTVYRPATFTQEEHNAVQSGQPVFGRTFTGGFYTFHSTNVYESFVAKSVAEGSDIVFHQDVPAVQTIAEVAVNYYAAKKLYYGGESSYNNTEKNTSKTKDQRKSSAQAINSQSPYVILTYMNKRIMLTGDSTVKNEEEWLERNLSYNIDVLKVQHHGSADGNNPAFFENIFRSSLTPAYAVISVGLNNTHNHPNARVMRDLKAVLPENNIMQTSVNGNIVANVNTGGQLYFGADVPEVNIWISYWHIAVGVLVIAATALFANEVAKISKKKTK